MIQIKSFRSGRITQPYDYRCDRANKILGNHPGQGLPRAEAIKAFGDYLAGNLAAKGKNPVKDEMNKIYALYKQYGRLNLFCWCAPLPCHTELIKDRLDAAIQARRSK